MQSTFPVQGTCYRAVTDWSLLELGKNRRAKISTLFKVGAHLSSMIPTPEPSSELDLHACLLRDLTGT